MNSASRTSLEGVDKSLEILWQDSERVFCRISRNGADDDQYALMPACYVGEHPAPDAVKRLEHEYELKDYLERDWAVRPLELTRDHGRTILAVDFQGGERLDKLIGSPMEVGKFLRLAIALSTALGRLHARGLVHKDVKPTNIVVNEASNRIWLTGFGIASRLPREHQPPNPPEFIAGTLPYMAPEQTGRMNRSIDSRSDLYSLGITLYEMFVGALPFTASDPMEWVHCHIARVPVAPSRRCSEIPEQLSAIIMKLLAKAPEERYQTAAGVEADLRRCLSDLEARGQIESFSLGAGDVPDRLLVPEKLYGREKEVELLLAAFDRVVRQGTTELALVSGYSGVGKSSVVNELHKVLVPSRGLFASGKFDQYKRDIPYATLAQAFQGLIRQILGKSELEIAAWRDSLREKLGPNGQLMVNLIPELELVIGEQPSIVELPPAESQTRFQTVFRHFLGVFARPEHPLALFLDDLQWLDAATVNLVKDLITHAEIRHLLLIGAYRDNEVSPSHPIMRTLAEIRKIGAPAHQIELAPLGMDDVGQLIAEALHCERERAQSLARIVHEKTDGNPFFTIQFIAELEEEGLLAFAPDAAAWRWDVDRIQAKGYTDNVVDLMVGKLNRFPKKTRDSLKQLACLGNSAEIAVFSMVYGGSEERLDAALWDAVCGGLISRSEERYAFVHDRVQEAAYALIPECERAAAHLRIGRIFVEITPQERLEDMIFDIVNQLNRASSLVTLPEERERLAEFNLLAGKRAQASSAYVSALNYLTTGAALLTHDSWQQRRELSFALELARAHCEFASGTSAQAEERLRNLSIRAVTTGERAAVASLQVDLYQAIDRNDEAVAVGLRALHHLGIDLPERPTEVDARLAYDGILTQLGARAIEDLINLPLITAPDLLATLDLLIRVAVAGFFESYHLGAVAVCKAVSLGLERGHSDASCIAYAQLSTLAGPHFGQFEAGYRFGRLGCDLAERPGLQRFQARALETFGFIVPWTQHVRTGREFLFRGFDIASRVGEIIYAGYACGQLNTNYLMAGDHLIEAQEQAEQGLAFARKVGFGALEAWVLGHLGLIRSLRGLTDRFGFFNDAVFRESDLEHDLAGNPALALPECWYYIRKLQARFFAGEYADALQAASKAQPMLGGATATLLEIVEYHFYDALCRAAVYDSASSEDRRDHCSKLKEHSERLDTWRIHCPENFANRAALVGAEVARIEGRDADAMRLYEQAIRSAREHGFVQNEGVAHEVAARFYAARGLQTIADSCLWNAKQCYVRWGAEGKVQQLARLYPHLTATDEHLPAAITVSPVQNLDVASVVKASQALSSEIVLPKLIERLMKIAIENAGADHGFLMLPSGPEYLIQAEARATGDQIEVTIHQELITRNNCPESLIRYVIRTRESVILDDASKPNLFSDDDYLRDRQSKSILCLPLIKQRELTGILLLENALTSHAFTPARIAVLELLAAQAAISLENTRLYSGLKEREAKIRRLVDANIMGIIIWRPDGHVVDANEAFLRLVNYSRDDLLSGRVRWTDLTPTEWRDRDEQALAEIKTTGAFRPFEKEYLRKDGSRVPVLIGGAIFETNGSEGVAFILDLRERKSAEEALRRARADLAHVSRITTLGEMTASIAHEVNQPLGAVVNNANACLTILPSGSPRAEEIRQALEDIIEGADRASAVISRIRNLSKKVPYESALVDLNHVVAEVMSLVRHDAATRQVNIQIKTDGNLPTVRGDRVQLQQVLLNLVANGMEAMTTIEPSNRTMTISSFSVMRDEQPDVQVSVQDTGTGFKPEEQDRLFEAFYSTKPDGMGMGLAISRSIIEAHGGRLWAEPNHGAGVTFQFSLPIASQNGL